MNGARRGLSAARSCRLIGGGWVQVNATWQNADVQASPARLAGPRQLAPAFTHIAAITRALDRQFAVNAETNWRRSPEPYDSTNKSRRAAAAMKKVKTYRCALFRNAIAARDLRSLLMALGYPWRPTPRRSTQNVWQVECQTSTAVVDHASWTNLLATYVVASADGINRVRYADFKRDGHAALKAYVKVLEAVDVAQLSRSEQMAFWANLYNAKTIDIVLDAYPVKSIKDISLGGGLLAAVTGGPWKAKVLKVSGESLSLDDIEHGILRPVFKDPRVHYAVNCASIGCPNLMREAFTGATLDAQLDAGARAYVNHPRGITVTGSEVTASSIYDWFGADFGGEDRRPRARPPLCRSGIETKARRYHRDFRL